MKNGFSVIMPTYNQAFFIRRAILSLQYQTYTQWELIIIDDGSTDSTYDHIKDLIDHTKIKYIRYEQNMGMGYAINRGLDLAQYDYIAYLPSDDYYYENHLENLKKVFGMDNNNIVLAFSGLNFNDNDAFEPRYYTEEKTLAKGYCLQLVQTAHKKTSDRWIERNELVTEDLYIMFWVKLADKGCFVPTYEITAKWTCHPHQRYKLISETYRGNIYKYKSYYKVTERIRIRMSKQKIIDETELYKPLKTVKVNNPTLKILIIGALSYNPERISALEEHGCKLYGYWKNNPEYAFESVGPFPFGNIEDIEHDDQWIKKIKDINPDIIYTVFSSTSLKFVYDTIMALKHAEVNIPFLWHLKEAPQVCMRYGFWNELMTLYTMSAGNLFTNMLTKEWFTQFIKMNKPYMILDQDMPKIDYFTDHFSTKLSSKDGEIHTVVPGRMVGLTQSEIKQLATHHIHVHLYSESYFKEKQEDNNSTILAVPKYFHVHSHCPNNKWTEEFSKYDAGWLHCFNSKNNGDMLQLSWDDLNKPSRMGVFAAAGIPMIQRNNHGNIVASQNLIRDKGIGILYNNIDELENTLKDNEKMKILKKNVMEYRSDFAFDSHIDEFVNFINQIIAR